MVAYILYKLGYGLMKSAHSLKHESSPICRNTDGGIDIEETRAAISLLDEEYLRWAWKSPGDLFVIGKFIYFLRNPIIILVHRNPLDTIYSACAKEGLKPDMFFTDYSIYFAQVAALVESPPCKIVHLSFESLKRNPHSTVSQLAEELNLSADERLLQDISASISVTGYKPLSSSVEAAISDSDLKLDAQMSSYMVGIPWLKRRIYSIQNMCVDTLNAILCLRYGQEPSLAGCDSLFSYVDIALHDFIAMFMERDLACFASSLAGMLVKVNGSHSVFREVFPLSASIILSQDYIGSDIYNLGYIFSSKDACAEAHRLQSRVWFYLVTLRTTLQRRLDFR